MKSRMAVLTDGISLLIGNGAEVKEIPYDDLYQLSGSSNAE
jgi:hypothetical protein